MLCAGQLGITLPAWGSRSMQRTPALHSNDANSGDNCCHWEEYGPALRHHRDMGSDNPSWFPTADSQQQWIFAERTCWAKWVFCMFKNLPCIFFHYLAQLFYFIFFIFCFVLVFSLCTLQATAVPCLRHFTAELWVLRRTTCFCFEPAICYLYSMPTHSCSRRESKHIVPYSLSLCHSWICPIRFHPSLLLCLVIPWSSWLVTSVACCYPFLSFAECIFNCSIACFANCLYCHFSIQQPSATHLPMKAFLHCPVVLKHGRGVAVGLVELH